MTLKINHATMDAVLADIAKAMVELRDNQNLIRCSDKDDICNDFDVIRDHVADLRKRFWRKYEGHYGPITPEVRPQGAVNDIWPIIKQAEDPGV